MAMKYLDAMEISGDAFWVGTTNPDIYDPKGRYTMVVGNLNDGAVAAIKALGGNVLTNPNKENQGRYIKLKSGYPINAKSATGEDLKIVGNGSKVRVSALPAAWDFAGKNGVSFWVGKSGIVVDELKVYIPDDVDTDDEVL